MTISPLTFDEVNTTTISTNEIKTREAFIQLFYSAYLGQGKLWIVVEAGIASSTCSNTNLELSYGHHVVEKDVRRALKENLNISSGHSQYHNTRWDKATFVIKRFYNRFKLRKKYISTSWTFYLEDFSGLFPFITVNLISIIFGQK